MKRTMMGMGTMGNRDGLGADGSIESSAAQNIPSVDVKSV